MNVEKLFDDSSVDESKAPREQITSKCKCGRDEGDCISNLSCKCPAIAKCKQMKVYDPFITISTQKVESGLETTEINVINIRRGIIEVIIPDWDPDETIGLSPNEIPKDVMDELEPGVVLEADVNLNAKSAEDLILDNLRLVYEDEEDGDEEKDDHTAGYTPYYSSSLSLNPENKLPELSLDEDDEDDDEDYEDFDDGDDEDFDDEDFDDEEDFLDEESEENNSFGE